MSTDFILSFFNKAKIETIKKEKEVSAETFLRTQFKMELLVYSQDRTYSSSLSDRRKEEDEDEKSSKCSKFSPRVTFQIVQTPDYHATLQELMRHLKSYYRVSLKAEQ